MITSLTIDSIYPNLSWAQFIMYNDARSNAFEEMCRAIFQNEFVQDGITLHSNPNNPGIEVEPVPSSYSIDKKRQSISFQAKFFDHEIHYSAIKESISKAIKYYSGKLDIIYLFCNLPISTNNKNFKPIENMLKEANMELRLVTDKEIFRLLINHPDIVGYYFHDRIRGKEKNTSTSSDKKSNSIFQHIKSVLCKKNVIVFVVILCLIAGVFAVFSAKNKRTILSAPILMPLSTRSGPSTRYDEAGVYFPFSWENQTVQVLGKYWDRENDIWWILVDFTYNNQARYRVWTGAKRVHVDIKQLDEIKRIYTGVVLATHDTYRGPGTDYAKAEINITDTTAVDVYGRENGFTEIEFELNGQKHRLWVPDWQVDSH